MARSDISRLRELSQELLARAQTNPDSAGPLAEGVAQLLERDARRRAGVRTGRRAAPVLDPFEIYRADPAGLAGRLEALDLEQLRDVVAYYGMDPRRLVMKWKSPDRVVSHIVETVETRSRKGDVFRGPSTAPDAQQR